MEFNNSFSVLKWFEIFTILNACSIAALLYLGILFAHYYVWTPFKLYVAAQMLPGVDFRNHGEWAVITGATDGIGEFGFGSGTSTIPF
mgnify:CR=1 FL=1